MLACLVLKEFFTTDYRGIAQILTDSRDPFPDIVHFEKALVRIGASVGR